MLIPMIAMSDVSIESELRFIHRIFSYPAIQRSLDLDVLYAIEDTDKPQAAAEILSYRPDLRIPKRKQQWKNDPPPPPPPSPSPSPKPPHRPVRELQDDECWFETGDVVNPSKG